MANNTRKGWTGTRFTEALYAPHAAAIGQFVLTWNDLHEALASLFTAILSHDARLAIPAHEKNRGMYAFREMERLAGIWSSSLYDRPKRSMLEALLSPLVVDDFIAFPDFLEDIKWILSETDKIEDIRNNAVHAPLKMDLRPGVTVDHFLHGKAFVVAPNVQMKNRRALRLLQKHPDQITLLKEVRWARDASALLRDFTQHIVWALTDDEHPWPRRPSLPNGGQKKTRRNR